MAEFNMKLTQGGAVLLAKVQAEKELKFKYITLGKGVFEGNPEDATTLVSKVIDLNIQEKTRKDTVAFLKATLTYNAVPDGFVWTELGIIAVDPDTHAEVLYMYGYSQFGDIIPPATAATQIEKVIQVASYVGNAQNVTAVIDESLINIPRSDINQPNGVAGLNKDGVLDIEHGGTGANNVQEALYNLGAKSNDNLLDNANFAINQQKKDEYTKNGLTADRWFKISGTGKVIINSDGTITLDNTNQQTNLVIQQRLSKNATGMHTIAVLAGTKLYTASGNIVNDTTEWQINTPFDNFTIGRAHLVMVDGKLAFNFNINAGQKITLNVCKINPGNKQTLAWQHINGNWYQFDLKNDGELLKCQKFYEQTAFATCYGVATSTEYIDYASSIFYISEKNKSTTISVGENTTQPLLVNECDTLKKITDAVIDIPIAYNPRMLSPRIHSPSGAFAVGKIYRIQVPDNAYIVDANI